ncbi:MAG: hypothetical protein ACLR4Z_02360 [Butyricicoccaceae bacterium]
MRRKHNALIGEPHGGGRSKRPSAASIRAPRRRSWRSRAAA